MDPKRNSNQIENNVDGLVKSLLKSCEVNNLAEFYNKWLENNNNIVLVDKIADFHKGFSPATIKSHIENLSDFLIINSINFKKAKSFEKKKYLVNYIGFAHAINKLKKKKIISKTSSLQRLLNYFNIPLNQQNRLIAFLERAIKEVLLYAKIYGVANRREISFYNKLKHPTKRKLLIELIATLTFGILIILLFPIIFSLI
jgi:hypothetical protein